MKSVILLVALIFSVTASAKFGSKPPRPKACEEAARSHAFAIGVDPVQGNDPSIGDVTLKKEKTAGFETELVFEIEVQNQNEDGETWIHLIKVEITKSVLAGACILGEATKLKTILTEK